MFSFDDDEESERFGVAGPCGDGVAKHDFVQNIYIHPSGHVWRPSKNVFTSQTLQERPPPWFGIGIRSRAMYLGILRWTICILVDT